MAVFPLFKRLSTYEAINDIALIKLKNPLDFKKNRSIQPACLDKQKTGNSLNMTIVGFGSTKPVSINASTGEILDFSPSINEGIVEDFVLEDPACKSEKANSMCVKNRSSNQSSYCLGAFGNPVHKTTATGLQYVLGVLSIPTPEIINNNEIIKVCTKRTRVTRIFNLRGWIHNQISKNHCG